MSDDLALTEVLEARPADLERRLSTALRVIGNRIVERPEIVRAMTAAEQLKEGYVIADDAAAVEIADLVAQIIDGERVLTEQIRLALRIPKQMETALKGAVDPVKNRLANAKVVGNSARVAWQNTLRRRAAEEEQKRRQEAEEAAKKAAEQAEALGEDAPPVAEVGPVDVPRSVIGGTGKMGTQVRIEPAEIVDFGQVPQAWLTLIPGIARAVFLADVLQGKVKKPGPGESVIYHGVRFEAKEFSVNRR